jgi:lipopolysaccharide transport system ATP-binding protein
MSDVAIRVEHLSKEYRIGARNYHHDTLRDVVSEKLAWPAHRIASFLGRNGARRPERNPVIEPAQKATIWALKDVSFDIKQGEVVGVIGRNGAGKSTLFKLLSRITEPTGGRASIYGRVGSLLETGIGFHLELTGRENIYLNGAILGMRKAEIDRKFDEIVAFSEVQRFIDTPVKRYSSGMYVRLAFAVAAHLESDILLVDEVLAVGDAAFQKKCLGRMGDVARQGRTVLFVSHNMASVAEFCPKALFLDNGTIVASGRTEEVIKAYLASLSERAESVMIEPPRVDKGVRLRRIGVADHEMKPCSEIDFRLPYFLTVEFEVTRAIPQLSLAVRLVNDFGVNVLHSWAVFQEAYAPGRYVARGQFPHALLAPGRYYVDVAAERYQTDDYRVDDYHYAYRCLAFDILKTNTEQHDGLSGWGAILPRIPWTKERVGI